MFGGVYRGKRILLTGHTGFKGSYLAFWLQQLGAELCGVALPPETEPSHFELLKLEMDSHFLDLRDREALRRTLQEFRPEIVFHLAAQPLVRRSYREPLETFATNITGTVNLLQAIHETDSVRAAVIVTSDKCYLNRELQSGYREDDPLGGFDPYSASKACQEIVAASYRDSFLSNRGTLLATARAGNVIGGGDWAEDRLIPDLVRAAIKGKIEFLRHPAAVRPWQHVLEPLSGYLELGRRLWNGETSAAAAWNFGPQEQNPVSVGEAAALMKRYWPRIEFDCAGVSGQPHETSLLQLDCSKAERELNWRGIWNIEETFRHTAEHYRNHYENETIQTAQDLEEYIADAVRREAAWTK